MERNYEVVKKLLLFTKLKGESFMEVEGVSDTEFFNHAELLADAGLIKISYFNENMIRILRLTWKGHDAAEALETKPLNKIEWHRYIL